MDEILDAPVEAQRRFVYAGFWIRFAAALIDGLFIWLLQWVLSLFIGVISYYEGIYLLPVLLQIGYYTAMESSSRQATIGKLAMRIKVGDANGDRISFLNAVGRYFGKILSAVILLIGYLMAAWDPKCQALHDKLANTYVFYADEN